MANVGRPRKYESALEMEIMIDKYFNSITKTELAFESKIVGYEDKKQTKPIYEKVPVLNNNGDQITRTYYFQEPTIISLCKYLGIDRSTLIEYEKLDEFSNTIKKAKAEVEEYLERQLYRKDQVTGIIFNLKNNFGWKDKTEIESKNENVNTNVEVDDDDFIEQLKQKYLKK